MEIRHLLHFVALAEEGQFTAAARRMNIGGFKEQVQHFPLGDSCIWGRVFNI